MAVPEDVQAEIRRWCAGRVPEHQRDRLRIGYSVRGDQVTITERHPPAFPELGSAWSSTPVAQLRYNNPEAGLWRIYQPSETDRWARYDHPPSSDAGPLLDEIVRDPTSVFWG